MGAIDEGMDGIARSGRGLDSGAMRGREERKPRRGPSIQANDSNGSEGLSGTARARSGEEGLRGRRLFCSSENHQQMDRPRFWVLRPRPVPSLPLVNQSVP